MQASNDQREYWDSLYNNPDLRFPENDGFLSEWIDELKQKKKIVELGCGNGVNTLYLRNHGIESIACDFSEPALKLLLDNIPDANILLFDMTDGLPFMSNNIDVIIADLSLHYFSLKDTKAILSEIRRSLVPNGLFLCRVNAHVPKMSFEGYKKIERDYYEIDGCKKRFFTVESLTEVMNGFLIQKIVEQETSKYRFKKTTIICEAHKLE